MKKIVFIGLIIGLFFGCASSSNNDLIMDKPKKLKIFDSDKWVKVNKVQLDKVIK